MSTPTPILQYTLNNKDLLPAGYTPLAYIESTTAGEYIDTGFKYSSGNITVDCEYTIPSNNDATIFGCSNDNSKWLLLIYRYSNASGHYCGTVSGTWGNSEPSGGKRRITYSISGTTCTLNDGKQNVSSSCGTIPALTYSYTLWCHHYNGSFVQKAQNARIYYFRLIYQGNLTLDYRPARRDSDGVLGMYDLVSRTFKTNSGSGSFIAGPPLAVGKGGGKSLPEEYLLVEWLLSPNGSTTYINTGMKATSTTGTIMLYSNPNYNSSAENIFYGASSQVGYAGGSNYCMETYGPSNTHWALGSGSTACSSFSWTSNTLYNIKLNYNGDGKLYVNGSLINTRTGQTSFPDYNLYIFGRNVANGVDTTYSKYRNRIHYLLIYSGTSLIRFYIPCYRKSDIKPGMYDTVNGVFYTNAGSGEFILGPTVNAGYTCEVNCYAGTNIAQGTDYTESSKYTHSSAAGDGYSFPIVYWHCLPGEQITVSFDTDVTNWSPSHGASSSTYGKFAMWNYWHNTYNPSSYSSYDRPDWFGSSSIVHLGGTRWKYTETVPDGMTMGSLRINSYSSGSTLTGYFWNFCVTHGSTGSIGRHTSGLYTNLSTVYDSSKGWVASGSDTSASYIEFDKSIMNALMTAKTFSIVFWARIHNTNRHIFLGDGSASYPLNLEWEGYKFRSYFSGSPDVHGTHTLNPNIWYHLALCVTSSGFVQYVNGEVDYTYSSAPTFGQLTDNCRIGSDSRTTQIYMGADISNFMIFDTSLTAAQVKELYGK